MGLENRLGDAVVGDREHADVDFLGGTVEQPDQLAAAVLPGAEIGLGRQLRPGRFRLQQLDDPFQPIDHRPGFRPDQFLSGHGKRPLPKDVQLPSLGTQFIEQLAQCPPLAPRKPKVGQRLLQDFVDFVGWHVDRSISAA